MTEIKKVLANRGSDYGDYRVQTEITDRIKAALHAGRNWGDMPPYIRDALDMIAVKMSRIVNGDFSKEDNFVDISGYATLALDSMNRDIEEGNPISRGSLVIDPSYLGQMSEDDKKAYIIESLRRTCELTGLTLGDIVVDIERQGL